MDKILGLIQIILLSYYLMDNRITVSTLGTKETSVRPRTYPAAAIQQ